jgi:hypothetical protein
MAPEEQECFHKTMDTVERQQHHDQQEEDDHSVSLKDMDIVDHHNVDVLDVGRRYEDGIGGDDSFIGSEFYVESADGNGSTTTTPLEQAATTPPPLARQETQAVKYVRVLVLAVLIMTTVIVAVTIYVLANRYEEDAFELAVQEQALAISHSWTTHLEQQLMALQALGVSMTSYAAVANASSSSSWPLVTIPDFEQRVGPLASLVERVMVLPLISDHSIRSSWEDYALVHQDWIQESLATASTSTSTTDPDMIFETIFTLEREEDGVTTSRVVEDSSPPFLPVWQSSPVQVDVINYNLMSQTTTSTSTTTTWNAYIHAALQSQLAVLSDTLMPESSVWNVTTSSASSPHHFLFYPLFDGFGSDAQLVGLLATISVWESYFTAAPVPPSSSPPMVGVVENTCGQTFSYQIQDDSSVRFLGVGDWHDTHYNPYEITQDLVSSLDYYAEDDGAAVSLLQGDPRVCDYVLRIYPTREFETVYRSNRPGLYMVAVGLMAVAVLFSFWMYHCFVERRQTAVVKAARRSQAIVGSLFPSVVHDRLFTQVEQQEEQEQQQQQKQLQKPKSIRMGGGANSGRPVPPERQNSNLSSIDLEPFNPLPDVESKESTNISLVEEHNNNNNNKRGESLNQSFHSTKSEPPTQQLRTFLSQPSPDFGSKRRILLENSKPIADLFPNATVMFADISGFTAWSSVREPAQVFTLLETIYSCFDKLAKKRKVSTIAVRCAVYSCCFFSLGCCI